MATHDHFDCPPTLDLLDYSGGALREPDAARVRAHLEQCDVCAELVRNLRSSQPGVGRGVRDAAGVYEAARQPHQPLSGPGPDSNVRPEAGEVDLHVPAEEPAKRFRELLAQRAPAQWRLGHIWTVSGIAGLDDGLPPNLTPERWLVVLLAAEAATVDRTHMTVAVAPISLDTEYAADRDLIVPAAESPLGCPFMVEVWNEATILSEQLGRYLGDLPQPLRRSLGFLYKGELGTDVDLRPLRGSVGPAITGESDPRVVFQEDEHERCEALRRPLLRVLGDLEQQMGQHAAELPAAAVLRLARQHLPSAFPEQRPQPEPLTAGHVAARIEADQAVRRTLSAAELMANRRLLSSAAPLPVHATAKTIAGLLAGLGIEAGEVYRELFRRTAVKLAVAAQESELELAAARRQSERRRRAARRPDADQPQ